LHRFLRDQVGEVFSTVHLLPFFPYSSDDGFSVVHFRQVRPELGDWPLVEALARDYRLMVDLVLNHVSRQCGWFLDFETGVAPGATTS
jgi:glycosidase